MRARIILYILLIFTFITSQVTIANSLKIFGVAPNLALILIVSISLLEGRTHGETVGFFTGLCLDAVIGSVLGYYALFGMLLGLALGNINKRFFKENVLVMVSCTFISSLVYESAIALSTYLFFYKIDLLETLRYYILPEACINSVLGIILFIVIIRLNRYVSGLEGKKLY
jgi:rod shape-determining protein MreD